MKKKTEKSNKQTDRRKTCSNGKQNNNKSKKSKTYSCPVCTKGSLIGSFQWGFCDEWAHYACRGHSYRDIVHESNRSSLRCKVLGFRFLLK